MKIVEDYRESIRSLSNNTFSLQESSLYFDNMTIYVDTLFAIQASIGSEIFENLTAKINMATLNIAVWSIIIAMVIVMCPVQVNSICMHFVA